MQQGRSFRRRVRGVLVNLAILAAVLVALWFLLRFRVHPLMMGALVVAVLLPLAFPERYEELVSGVMWLGLAGVAYALGATPLAVIGAVVGIAATMGAVSRLRVQGAGGGPGA